MADRIVARTIPPRAIRAGEVVAREVFEKRNPPDELCCTHLEGIVLLMMAECWARGYMTGRAS